MIISNQKLNFSMFNRLYDLQIAKMIYFSCIRVVLPINCCNFTRFRGCPQKYVLFNAPIDSL